MFKDVPQSIGYGNIYVNDVFHTARVYTFLEGSFPMCTDLLVVNLSIQTNLDVNDNKLFVQIAYSVA